MRQRLRDRYPEYQAAPQSGLFSLLTVVEEPAEAHFDELCWSVGIQDYSQFEWIIVDQCRSPRVKARLGQAAKDSRVKVVPGGTQRGLVAGYRTALQAASQRYLVPVEAEDRLYPDALRVLAAFLQQHNVPAIVYTDEDQLPPSGSPEQPFCKPDWDPLLLHSAGYTTRLAAIDRQLAGKTGAFTDEAVGDAAIWDAHCRLVATGATPVHLPEILCSRRVRQAGPALPAPADQASAGYAVVRHHLRRQRLAERLNVRANPLLGTAGLWRLAWQRGEADLPIHRLVPGHTLQELAWKLQRLTDDSLVAVHEPGVLPLTDDWADEARCLFAALPDAVAVTGAVVDGQGVLVSAGEFLGVNGLVGSPYAGQPRWTLLGHGRLLCQQTVGAPSQHFFVVEVGFLKDLLETRRRELSLSLLHAWLGAEARERGFRVVYTPHLQVEARGGAAPWHASAEEMHRFLARHGRQVADDPAWSRFLGLAGSRVFHIVPSAERAEALRRLFCHLAGTPAWEEFRRWSSREYPPRQPTPTAAARPKLAA